MEKYLHPHSPWRIFAVSGLLTVGSIIGVLLGKGIEAMTVALILISVEVAFSFDNAIVNAKILKHMSRFWQTMFLTVGAAIAIFGMRLVFPVVLVAITAGIGWQEVVDLAVNHPHEYAKRLEESHIVLSAFGGAFLLMLALHFFVDDSREVLWFQRLERHLQRLAYTWAPALIALVIVAIISVLPMNHAKQDTMVAGVLGIVVYSTIHWLSEYFGRIQSKSSAMTKTGVRTGLAGFISFMYLEVLDASFSFDGVLGAFAVTQDIVLIAIGLGVGAFWVRSLTIFMVRRGTLDSYRYIDHGAHYTIGILAVILLVSIFVHVPEVIAGMAGIGVIGASIIASRQALKASLRAVKKGA